MQAVFSAVRGRVTRHHDGTAIGVFTGEVSGEFELPQDLKVCTTTYPNPDARVRMRDLYDLTQAMVGQLVVARFSAEMTETGRGREVNVGSRYDPRYVWIAEYTMGTTTIDKWGVYVPHADKVR